MPHPPRAERPAMADYGVPADTDGTLPWSWAEERLARNRNYWVVTASASGRPHAMPVWGVWLADAGEFWFSCSPNARKLRNIDANPNVVVAIDDTVECISLEGRARRAERGEAAPMADAYLAKYWDDPAVHDEMREFVLGHAVVAVTPERAFGIIEREAEFAERATRWVW
jgi:hypothetical protein